jgi:nitroreductase
MENQKAMLDCIATRHSTRKFKPELVADELLRQVIEAGRQAPSGKNKQQNHFLVIRKPEVLAKLVALVRQEFARMEITEANSDDMGGAIKLSKKGTYVFKYNAPILIVVANKKGYGNNFADTSIAIQNMMLAANALDLGTCWINQLRWLQDNSVILSYLRNLGMADDEIPFGAVSIGYPATADGLPNRQGLPLKGNAVTYID